MRANRAYILSIVMFGTIGLVVRNMTLESSVIALARGVLGALFLLAVMKKRRAQVCWKSVRENAPWLLTSGILLGFNWIALFEAYRFTTVSIATLCYYMQPVIVTLLSPLVFREKLTLRKGICVAAAMAGMVMISGISGGNTDSRGILLGLLAAALYSVIIIANKKLHDISSWDRTIVQLGISAAVMLPYCLLTHSFTRPSGLDWVLLAVVGIVYTGVTYYLYFGSLEYIPAQTAAILSYLDPVVAVLVSVGILGEPIRLVTIAGSVLILAAAVVSETEKLREQT